MSRRDEPVRKCSPFPSSPTHEVRGGGDRWGMRKVTWWIDRTVVQVLEFD